MTSTSRLRVVIGALALLAALACPATVRAQGTDGAIADPIGGRELLRYADRLELSDGQRLALDRIHETYRRDFSVLRDGEIAAFMASTMQMQGGMPSRDDARKLFTEWERLRDKVARIDDGLFDRLAPLLDERQAALLPRLRLARERARTGGGEMAMIAGGPIVDLSDICVDLDLDAEERSATDPVLVAYEHRLTADMRKLAESSARMFMDMFDALEAAGLADLDMTEAAQDPERMRELMQFWQNTWSDLTARSREIAYGIHELNGRTVRSLRAALPEETGTALRNRYYRRAFPRLRSLVEAVENDLLGAMLSDDTLTADERTTIEGIRAELNATMDRLLAEAITVQEAARAQMNPFEMDSDAMRTRLERLSEIEEEAARATGAAYAALEQAFELERSARLQRRAMHRLTGTDPGAVPGGSPGTDAGADRIVAGESDGAGSSPAAVPGTISDPLLPPRLTRRDIETLVRHVGITDEERTVVDELHGQHRAAFAALPEVERFTTTSGSLWSFDEATGQPTPPTRAVFERLDTERRSAIAAMQAAIDRFFDDVAAAVLDDGDDARRARLERLRRMHERRGMLRSDVVYGMQANGGTVDLVEFLLDQEIDDATWSAAADALAAYEEEAGDLLRERRDAVLALRRAHEQWSIDAQAAMAGARDDPAGAAAIGLQYQEKVGGATRRARAIGESTTALQERALDDLLAAMPELDGPALRRAWRRTAHPEMTDDPMSVSRHLAAALELEDLAPGVRRQVEELATIYGPEHDRLTDRMIEHAGDGGFMAPDMQDPDAIRAWTERRQNLERARFERTDLDYRIIGRLRAILSADQITRIGGLPEPPERSSNEAVILW